MTHYESRIRLLSAGLHALYLSHVSMHSVWNIWKLSYIQSAQKRRQRRLYVYELRSAQLAHEPMMIVNL